GVPAVGRGHPRQLWPAPLRPALRGVSRRRDIPVDGPGAGGGRGLSAGAPARRAAADQVPAPLSGPACTAPGAWPGFTRQSAAAEGTIAAERRSGIGPRLSLPCPLPLRQPKHRLRCGAPLCDGKSVPRPRRPAAVGDAVYRVPDRGPVATGEQPRVAVGREAASVRRRGAPGAAVSVPQCWPCPDPGGPLAILAGPTATALGAPRGRGYPGPVVVLDDARHPGLQERSGSGLLHRLSRLVVIVR